MTRAKDISKILTDADLSGTLDVTGTVTAGGNVGIGTGSPSELIHANGSSVSALKLTTNSYTNGTVFKVQGDGASYIYNTENAMLRFGTNNLERMRIDASGNVGIATSNPLSILDIAVEASDTRRFLVNYDDNIITVKGSNQNSNPESLRIVADNFRVSTGTTGSGTERLRITSSGNVGIGNTSPSTFNAAQCDNLVVGTGSGAEGITIYSGNTSQGGLAFADGTASSEQYRGLIQYDHTNNSLGFWTNTTRRMRINSNGEILIGTSTSVNASFMTINATSGGSGKNNITLCTDSTGTSMSHLLFANPNGNVGSVTTNGSSTSYNTSSDHRLKESVSYDFDATTRLKQLKPCRFNFIADADKTVDGFLAHEVQSVVPEAISGTHNEVDADGNPVYQGIDQSKLVPLLVKTIQELEARITALETA